MKTYIFKIHLVSGRADYCKDKNIIREIEVSPGWSLYKFAKEIVGAFGFDFDHCFGFFSNIAESRYFDSEKKYELFTDPSDIEPTGAESVKKTKVSEVWRNKGDKMMFLFDYGDNWKFIVELIGFR